MNIAHSELYIAVLLFSLLITIFTEKRLIVILRGKASQPIYEEGPSWHLKKKGTPTMGGLAFIITSVLCLVLSIIILLFFDRNNKAVISFTISLIFSIANGLVGLFDDLTKLRRQDNAGFSPLQKLFLQFLLAILFLMARAHYLEYTTKFDLLSFTLDLGFMYYPFAIFIILGIINCANLTDGVDGLAGSVALGIGLSFFYISHSLFRDAALLSILLIGISVAFLVYNLHPAKIFMGDTGSLFLGALAVSCAFSVGNLLIILPFGCIYVIEGISVILQVVYYKLTKKRLFKMAPIHHHLEKIGMSEDKLCISALIITLLVSLIINLL